MSKRRTQQATDSAAATVPDIEVTDGAGNVATVEGEPTTSESKGDTKSESKGNGKGDGGKSPTTISDLDASLREYATKAVGIVKTADQSVIAFAEHIAMWCAEGLPEVLAHLRTDNPDKVARNMTAAIVNTARANKDAVIKADSVRTGCATAITIAFSKSHLVQHILALWVSEKYKAPVAVCSTESGEVLYWRDADSKVRRHCPNPTDIKSDGNEVGDDELNEAGATFEERTFALRSTYDLRYIAPKESANVWTKLLTAIAAAVKAGTANMDAVKASEYLAALDGLAPVLRQIAEPEATAEATGTERIAELEERVKIRDLEALLIGPTATVQEPVTV